MSGEPVARQGKMSALDGWGEALLFTLTLSVLNVAYGLGNQLGVKPLAMLAWAMPSAAVMLMLVGGLGHDWLRVMVHPLSLVVGAGIIGMEAFYYLLLMHVTPTDGSILVRLGVPAAVLLGLLVRGRCPPPSTALGAIVITATILWYLPQMQTSEAVTSLILGGTCALIQSGRTFASEFHPWNRAARTIPEKMRITGLVLLSTSLAGLALIAATIGGATHGWLMAPAWLPMPADLAYPPAIGLGLAVGVVVLTAMQYLAFSTVVKLGTESFIATTALIPVATLAVQELAVRAGLLSPIPFDWSVFPAMAGVIAGVALVIAGQRRR
ncbi:MAG: hypothetical protein SFW09_08735 [Hyphomicrobiaceae bacterium]|nr:hypothetical protein [Hyphomicrobiaceae bacterium]